MADRCNMLCNLFHSNVNFVFGQAFSRPTSRRDDVCSIGFLNTAKEAEAKAASRKYRKRWRRPERPEIPPVCPSLVEVDPSHFQQNSRKYLLTVLMIQGLPTIHCLQPVN